MSKLQMLRDYTSVALTHPELLKEAARTIIHRKSRRLISELTALDEFESSADTSLPAGPRDLVKILAEKTGVLVLEESPRHIRIGINDSNFLFSLVHLQLSIPSGQLKIGEQLIGLASSLDRKLALAAQEITFTFSCTNRAAARLTLEPYMQRIDGVWLSNNINNSRARALYSDILCTPGLYSLSQVLPAPTLEMRAAQKPVDVVYAWLDHKYSVRNEDCQQRSREVDDFQVDANPVEKTRDEELRFSLRSVAANLPWARNIYIFTNSAVPNWVKADHPGIIWIDHKDVIPNGYLPTFSSQVIESFLHRIPDISEQFIYIQNDVAIPRPMDKSAFFHPAGYSYSFAQNDGVVSGPYGGDHPDYLNALPSSAQLIHETFGVAATQLYSRMVSAHRRDVLIEMESRWPDQLDAFRHNRFCTDNDLDVISFLYHHYAINTGRAVPLSIGGFTMVRQINAYRKNERSDAFIKKPQTTYISEGELRTPDWNLPDTAHKLLQSDFPVKAPWER